MNKSKPRRIKIQPRITNSHGRKFVRPELRLSGKWLEEIGFTNGQVATVTCEPKRLIITLE